METIKLQYKASLDGAEITELNMRRPKVRDVRDAEKGSDGEAELEIKLYANLCEVPPSVIEDLDIYDYNQIQAVYKGFLFQPKRPSKS